MQKIHAELTLNSIIAKQNSPINLLSQEKFSNFLEPKKNEEEIPLETIVDFKVIMQSLQNTAQLNKMVIESVA